MQSEIKVKFLLISGSLSMLISWRNQLAVQEKLDSFERAHLDMTQGKSLKLTY